MFGQEESSRDSLLQVLNSKPNDTVKVNTLNNLAQEYLAFQPDKSIFFSRKALFLSEKKHFYKGFFVSINYISRAYSNKNDFDSALFYLNVGILKAQKLKNFNELITIHKRIGIIGIFKNNYKLSISNLQKALDLAEKHKIKKQICSINNNFGVLFNEINRFTTAKDYLNAALALSLKINNQHEEAIAYANLAIAESGLKNYHSALEYQKKFLGIANDLKMFEQMALSYISIAEIYFSLKKYNRVLDNSFVALQYFEKSKDFQHLSLIYRNIGMAYVAQKDFAEALIYLNKAIKYSKKAQEPDVIADSYLYLSKLDSAQGNYKSALLHFQKYKTIIDSIYTIEKEKVISEMLVKYQMERKEKENSRLKENVARNQERIDRQHLINILLVLSSFLLLIVVLIGISSFLRIKKFSKLLKIKNNLIINKNAILEEKNWQIDAQNTHLETQNLELVEQKKLITASIKYALKIQMAVLPDKTILETLFNEYFIFFRPFQIVSGDFYWVKEVSNHLIIAVGDCTGHGVSGAFLSMLGISSLQEVVNKHESLNAAEILERLRIAIKKSLNQTPEDKQNDEGMDIGLCVLDKEKNELQFAGANRSLYLIFQNADLQRQADLKKCKDIVLTSNQTHTLLEIKPNKQPIGAFFKESLFTNHTIKISETDRFYLFSDGITDQLNKEEAKYSSKRFKTLLLNIQNYSLPLQKKYIKQAFDNWKEHLSQTDDVIVMGFKLKYFELKT